MNRLARTKSQHFVSSPRKSATPKHRRLRHTSKRRRIGSTLAKTVSDPESSSSDDSGLEDGGTIRRPGPDQRRVKLQIVNEASPRKRKRSDEASNVHSADSGSDLDSGSWIEVDDDDEPEFIAESDQHLLQDAPAYALHRLRKAELIRLWKVAGMWAEDDEIEDEDGEKGKKELIDGLIAARKPPSPVSTPSPASSPVSRSGDIDATPRAVPRTRAKARINGRKLFEENTRLKSTVKKSRPRITHRKRPSTSSSYTTTDASSPPTSPFQSPSSSRLKPLSYAFDEDATPLVHRLRSRTRSLLDPSEDGDAEDEYEESEADSPGPSTRLRSRTSSSSYIEIERPSRTAKKRAINAIAHMEDDVEMDEETEEPSSEPDDPRTTRSGKAFGQMQSRKRRLKQEALDDPELDDVDIDDDDQEDEEPFEPDIDLTEATMASLTRFLRDELVQMCENRAIEVGGTKSQLAKALLEWLAILESQSEASTARPSSNEIIHAVASHVHVTGKNTPVLLRDHIHAEDPATPPRTDLSKRNSELDLNLDLAELGLEDSVIKPESLQKLEKIGSGGFKDVYVGKLHGRKVAISEFREPLSEMDIRELKLLAEFRHPNIVRFRGISIPEDAFPVSCMLVSELCENGDLFDYIRNVTCPPVKRVLGLMLDIAKGLEYLHTRSPSIIHRDCKSSNILINSKGVAKVGDFGLARVKRSTRSMIKSLVGTVNWQAPELWHPAPLYDYKVDVFSAAMVYWEMMAGWIGEKKYPWEGHNEHYIYDAVGHKRQRPSTAGLREHWGDEPVNLMERMWHQDPGERPTMTDVVQDLMALKESH